MKSIVKTVLIAGGLACAGAACAGSAPPPATATAPPVPEQRVVPFAPRAGSGWTEGCVLLGFDVSNAGVPGNIRVLVSEPDHALDRLAVSTLAQWRYRPAIRAGQRVAAPDQKQMLVFRAPGSSAVPPYRLCGGHSSGGEPAAATGAPPASTARVNLNVTRPAVVQTFKMAIHSATYMPQQGRVSVRFCVSPQGRTESLRVVQSQPAGVFDEMALRLMRAALFKPHEVNGFAVTACNIIQPIVFKAAAT